MNYARGWADEARAARRSRNTATATLLAAGIALGVLLGLVARAIFAGLL